MSRMKNGGKIVVVGISFAGITMAVPLAQCNNVKALNSEKPIASDQAMFAVWSKL